MFLTRSVLHRVFLTRSILHSSLDDVSPYIECSWQGQSCIECSWQGQPYIVLLTRSAPTESVLDEVSPYRVCSWQGQSYIECPWRGRFYIECSWRGQPLHRELLTRSAYMQCYWWGQSIWCPKGDVLNSLENIALKESSIHSLFQYQRNCFTKSRGPQEILSISIPNTTETLYLLRWTVSTKRKDQPLGCVES